MAATENFLDTLGLEVVLRNSLGETIAGIWYRRGAWRVSTDHQLAFKTKEQACEAWEQLFDHETGVRVLRPPSILVA